MEAKTALVKYIFLDVVNYSHERSVEAQTEIINTLNKIVKDTLAPFNLNSESLIYLPTGDGICICIINTIDPYDIHINIAITLLKRLYDYNKQQEDPKRQFSIRIGINENHDNIITDINGNTNVAGSGINYAQRIMNMGDDNQIFLGQSVFDKLVQREKYSNNFHKIDKLIKHNILFSAYQYINKKLPYINDITKKEVANKKTPKEIAVYRFFTKYFEKDILKLSGSGSNNYTLAILLYYLTKDYMEFSSMESLERTKWESTIFDSTINNFEKAFQLIEKSFFWVICDSSSYYIEKLGLEKWNDLFKNDYLSANKKYDKKVDKEWPGLSIEINTNLQSMYQWAVKKEC